MLKTQNNKELVEIANTIHKELQMRCEHNCFFCDRDCMVMDMAKHVRAFGYTKSEKSVRRSMMEKRRPCETLLRNWAKSWQHHVVMAAILAITAEPARVTKWLGACLLKSPQV